MTFTHQQAANHSSVNVSSTPDHSLNRDDIQRDIKECNRLIKRAEYKIRLYERKLTSLGSSTPKTASLIQRGLRFFNLLKSAGKTV